MSVSCEGLLQCSVNVLVSTKSVRSNGAFSDYLKIFNFQPSIM